MAQSLVDRVIRKQGWLEPIADGIQKVVGGFYGSLGRPGRALQDLLHGTTLLGHPLHPAVTDIPVGAWIAGVVADWVAIGSGAVPARAGDLALIVGLGGALVSAASGYTDFHETFGHERRVAVAHGLTMTLVVVLEAASLGLRWWGSYDLHLTAVILATIALALVLGGAYLGGHLSFGMGTMVNRLAFLEAPEDFVAVGPIGDFPDNQMRSVDAAGLAVLVIRRGDKFYAMTNVCSHAGGPLNEGTLEGDIVTCPWHGSRFSLPDGRVTGGPATFSQAKLAIRQRDGVLEVKLAEPLH
ncbi:MAG: Rieske 2Fe-2S domain-containing protein [Chloroflexota bacterium]